MGITLVCLMASVVGHAEVSIPENTVSHSVRAVSALSMKKAYAVESFIPYFVAHFQLITPLEILQSGFDDTVGIRGSSTAVVCSIDGSKMCVINVGDSGCYLIRDQKVCLYHTKLLVRANCVVVL
jgi:hypothetical protein